MVELAGGAMVRPVADGGVMTTYAMQVELTCPHCGHPGLQPVTTTRPQPRLITTVLRCTGCRQEQAMRVELIPLTDNPDGCGTNAGYQRHQRNGEHPVRCQPCRAAHARDAADRRATNQHQDKQAKETAS